ncbi:unnamed protein product, partial [Prorocentrum cordatum]
AARRARGLTLDRARQPSSPAPELARAMQAFPVGKVLMEASCLHVAQSTEGDAATAACQCIEEVRDRLREFFEDAMAWGAKMRRDAPNVALCNINDIFLNMGTFFTTAHGSIAKRSAASAHGDLECVATNLQDAMAMLKVGHYMVVDVYFGLVGTLVPKLGDALLAFEATRRWCKAATAQVVKKAMELVIRTAKDSHVETIQPFSKLAELFGSSLGGFTSTSNGLNDRWQNCNHALHQRVGDAMFELIHEVYVKSPFKFGCGINRATGLLTNMLSHLDYCVKLANMKQQPSRTKQEHDAFAGGVAEFAGMAIHACCSASFFNGKLAEIAPNIAFGLGEVSEGVVRGAPRPDASGRLFMNVAIESLLRGDVHWVDGGDSDDKAVEAGNMDAVVIPSAALNGQVERAPVKGCSAQLRANAAMKATPDALFGSYAHAQSMASRSLARLDCLLASGEAREFAEQGWARAVNPQSARQWVRAAAVNAGASKNKLLEVMATAQRSEKIGADIFDDRTAVIAGYNFARNALTCMGGAGSLLDATPPVRRNDAAATSTATGIACVAI